MYAPLSATWSSRSGRTAENNENQDVDVEIGCNYGFATPKRGTSVDGESTTGSLFSVHRANGHSLSHRPRLVPLLRSWSPFRNPTQGGNSKSSRGERMVPMPRKTDLTSIQVWLEFMITGRWPWCQKAAHQPPFTARTTESGCSCHLQCISQLVTYILHSVVSGEYYPDITSNKADP